MRVACWKESHPVWREQGRLSASKPHAWAIGVISLWCLSWLGRGRWVLLLVYNNDDHNDNDGTMTQISHSRLLHSVCGLRPHPPWKRREKRSKIGRENPIKSNSSVHTVCTKQCTTQQATKWDLAPFIRVARPVWMRPKNGLAWNSCFWNTLGAPGVWVGGSWAVTLSWMLLGVHQ